MIFGRIHIKVVSGIVDNIPVSIRKGCSRDNPEAVTSTGFLAERPMGMNQKVWFKSGSNQQIEANEIDSFLVRKYNE